MLSPFKIQTFMTMDIEDIIRMIEFIGSEYLNEPLSLAYGILKAKIDRTTPEKDEIK